MVTALNLPYNHPSPLMLMSTTLFQHTTANHPAPPPPTDYHTLPLITISILYTTAPLHTNPPLSNKGKGKVFYGQEPPSGESTTTERGVNYQLIAVIC